MIPGITEVNFGPNTAASYATLHEATVTLVDMGERTISAQIRANISTPPDFSGWALKFKNELFVLPSKIPQATKDNSLRSSQIDLIFRSWVIEELKRYYYFQPAPINASTAIADQYQASVRMKIADFVENFNSVLGYYWPSGRITMVLNPVVAQTETTPYLVEIDHLKVWDVLTRLYDIFHQRWTIQAVVDEQDETVTNYEIRVGYTALEVPAATHTFSYGHEGGLLSFERQVQDEDITNVLLGRGGEKNLPVRYFKKTDTSVTPNLPGDPDAIPELATVSFDRLHDLVFRWYVRGWMHNPDRDTSGDEEWDPDHTFPTYSISPYSSPYYWAYEKGLTDETFCPPEYVKDDASITKYGEHWGTLEDNDEIFPTIQGRSREVLGRIDEAVDFSAPTNDDIDGYAKEATVEESIDPMFVNGPFFTDEDYQTTGWKAKSPLHDLLVNSKVFEVPDGKVGVITSKWVHKYSASYLDAYIDLENTSVVLLNVTSGEPSTATPAWDADGARISLIPPGMYRIQASITIHVDLHPDATPAQQAKFHGDGLSGSFGLEGVTLNLTNANENAWKPTFDVWVKNIWGTQKAYVDDGQGEPRLETDSEYAERVWLPILGGAKNQEARMVFTSGPLSISSDYEFPFAGLPAFDDSRLLNNVASHWRIKLYKSDAEYKTTGLFVPNAKTPPEAGDTFFFTGIEIPFEYVILAEGELSAYKSNQLSYVRDINPGWAVTLDKVRINTPEEVEEGEDPQPLLVDRLSPGIKIYVQDPRFAPTAMPLFIQSITYRWEEASDSKAVLVPDVEVVLSDKVVSQVSSVAKLQGQVDAIRADYVRADQLEETVRRVSSALFLKKTGEDDTSKSPTVFASKVTSDGFRQGGVGGSGWGLYRSMAGRGTEPKGDTVAEFDKVVVRKELQVETLVVNQIEAKGGKEILSAAKMQISRIEVNASTGCYDIYFDGKQGSISNTFMEGDIAFCQVFNSEWDTTPTKYYRMIVDSVDADRVSLLISSNDGTGIPEEGDIIVQYGHISNTARQYVIVRDVVGGGYERMLSGLTAETVEEEDPDTGETTEVTRYTDGVEYFFAGRQPSVASPRFFIGQKIAGNSSSPLNQYVEFVDGHLTIRGGVTVADADASTTIEGNIIQTGEISLGSISNDAFSVYAGISGVYSPTGIAAWYGGPKVDHAASPSATPYAKTLFRFDGSGYLASNRINWEADGSGSIPGVSWNAAASQVTIDSRIVFRGENQQLYGLVDTVKVLASMFTRENTGTEQNPVYRIKANYSLYTDGYLSSGGIGASGGGGGGTAVAWGTVNPDRANYRYLTINGSNDYYVALLDHHHAISEVDNLQGALNAKATPGDISTAINNLHLGTASQKDYTDTVSSTGAYANNLPTSAAVAAAIQNHPIPNASPSTKGGIKVADNGNSGVPIYLEDNSGEKTAKAISYLNVGTEQGSIVLPFFSNDLAFVMKRPGGDCTIAGNTNTADPSALFNGKPDYTFLEVASVSDTVTITITTPTDFTYNYHQRFYIDFGSTSWMAHSIEVTSYYDLAQTEEAEYYEVENLATPFWVAGNIVNGGTGVRVIVITLHDWATTTPRISEIGLQSFLSDGIGAAYMSRGESNDNVWRSINPAASNAYDLGTTGNMWRYVCAAIWVPASGVYAQYESANQGFHFSAGIFSDSYLSGGGVSSSSDIRLKDNLRPVELTLTDVANAPAVEFEWKKDGSKGAGSIAQYWENILPYNVRKNDEGMMSLEYGNIALLSTITVAREVERLRAEVAQLRKQLNA